MPAYFAAVAKDNLVVGKPGRAVACDERCEHHNAHFKESAGAGKRPLSQKSIKRHSVNVSYLAGCKALLREAMDMPAPSSHRTTSWGKGDIELASKHFDSLKLFEWHPGRRLPESFKTRADLAYDVGLRQAMKFLQEDFLPKARARAKP